MSAAAAVMEEAEEGVMANLLFDADADHVVAVAVAAAADAAGVSLAAWDSIAAVAVVVAADGKRELR